MLIAGNHIERGFAFVDLGSQAAVARAVTASRMNGIQMGGKKLVVEPSRKPVRQLGLKVVDDGHSGSNPCREKLTTHLPPILRSTSRICEHSRDSCDNMTKYTGYCCDLLHLVPEFSALPVEMSAEQIEQQWAIWFNEYVEERGGRVHARDLAKFYQKHGSHSRDSRPKLAEILRHARKLGFKFKTFDDPDPAIKVWIVKMERQQKKTQQDESALEPDIQEEMKDSKEIAEPQIAPWRMHEEDEQDEDEDEFRESLSENRGRYDEEDMPDKTFIEAAFRGALLQQKEQQATTLEGINEEVVEDEAISTKQSKKRKREKFDQELMTKPRLPKTAWMAYIAQELPEIC